MMPDGVAGTPKRNKKSAVLKKTTPFIFERVY